MKRKLGAVILLAAGVLALAACQGDKPTPNPGPDNPGTDVEEPTVEKLEYAEGTVLRIAGGYNDDKTAISFKNASVFKGEEGVTLSNGVTYHTNDLKPTWAHLEEKLKMKFDDRFTGAGSAAKEFAIWENQLQNVDIVAGSASSLVAAGSQGKLVDLNQYMDQMPNFKAYLAENQIARLSITGDTKTGAIYFSPYFDGVDDIERMPLARADMIRTLLDGNTSYSGANRAVSVGLYTPYMPTTGTVSVASLTADGKGTQSITKDYSKYGNIVAKMNATTGLTGNAAVKMFRDYIDATYGGKYAKRSDLFLGYDAAWDVDEMVALLRCAVASLNDVDGNPIKGLYSRETSNLQREIDLVRYAGHLFGVRGLESRQDFLYFDRDGNLHDARQEAQSYEAVLKMNALVKEGLIVVDGKASSTNYLEKDAGIMSYDYNQTQTVMNATKLQDGEEYLAIMCPVASWDDGQGAQYKRFTESWRSVKTDGWAITADGVKGDTNKLNAALTLIDFAFSVQGQITMSYGPDEFIKVKNANVEVNTWADVEKKYETFNFNGVQMPVISDGSFSDLQRLESGNYTNYARRYLGSTLNGFPKSQAFEYQCTNEVGKKGSAVLATAIGEGVIDHPVLAVNTTNMWYTSVPTTLPTTAAQTSALKDLTDLNNSFSSSKGGKNVHFSLIKTGTTEVEGFNTTNPTELAKFVATQWGGEDYLTIKNAQWNTLYKYYQTL